MRPGFGVFVLPAVPGRLLERVLSGARRRRAAVSRRAPAKGVGAGPGVRGGGFRGDRGALPLGCGGPAEQPQQAADEFGERPPPPGLGSAVRIPFAVFAAGLLGVVSAARSRVVSAALLGLTAGEVVAIHSATPLLMRCFGSPAGAPMLDGPAFSRPIPRRASPRAHVPPGAVAVAGRQAVVSTRPAPGGWQVLGTTPLTLVDPDRDPLTAYWPGDWFRFVSISADAFAANRGVLE